MFQCLFIKCNGTSSWTSPEAFQQNKSASVWQHVCFFTHQLCMWINYSCCSLTFCWWEVINGVFVALRSDLAVWVHGGRSEGRVGHEPAEVGRQRHRLGRPELREVTVTSERAGSGPRGFVWGGRRGLHDSSLVFVSVLTWSSEHFFTAAVLPGSWLLVRRSESLLQAGRLFWHRGLFSADTHCVFTFSIIINACVCSLGLKTPK